MGQENSRYGKKTSYLKVFQGKNGFVMTYLGSGSSKLSVKGQTVNILDFAEHTDFVATTQLCFEARKQT